MEGVCLGCYGGRDAFPSSCGGGGGEDNTPGTIELNNNSVVTIDGFYLAPVDQRSWGPNILSGSLFPGQRTFIVDIYPDYYDAKIGGRSIQEYFGYLSFATAVPTLIDLALYPVSG